MYLLLPPGGSWEEPRGDGVRGGEHGEGWLPGHTWGGLTSYVIDTLNVTLSSHTTVT